MKTLAAIKLRMLPGARLLCIENTYRPALNGGHRTVVKSGPCAWKFTVDGEGKVSVGFWPKASDVTIIDADTFGLGFEMGGKAHHVTLRFVGDGSAAPPKQKPKPTAGAPLVFADSAEAYKVVESKATRGHNDWLVWRMKDETYRAARMPDADALESAMKDAAVSETTGKPIVVMIDRTGTRLSPHGVWKAWASNMRGGHWS